VLRGRLAALPLLLALIGAGPQQNPDGFGVGAHPVSESIASAWFIQSVSPESKTLAFLAFLKGQPGWINGGTQWDWDLGDPAHSEFQVGRARFRLELWRAEGRARIFDHDAPLSRANVVVVSGVDSPSPTISHTFKLDLRVPAKANSALYLLEQSSELRAAVFGNQ
jgi:hypothetical protein